MQDYELPTISFSRKSVADHTSGREAEGPRKRLPLPSPKIPARRATPRSTLNNTRLGQAQDPW